MTRRLAALVALLAGACAPVILVAPAAHAATTYRVLFDDTTAETAGNADWIISTSIPDPTAQNPNPTRESDWTGALSAWGVALQRTGTYTLATLGSGSITYGGSGAQDLSKYNAFVLPEPNVLFTSAEKTAIMKFVQNGGGLFMISDHNGSDRNNDGADSVKVLNDLMTNNSVDSSDPFGFSIDSLAITTQNPNVIGAQAAGDAIIDGPFGTVTGTIIRSGTTATLHPADNSAVRGEVFRSGYSASGTTGAAVVTSGFGSGRVAYWGDSSPIDDGTGQSGNSLDDGWDDPAGTDAAVALNATQWLAGGGSGGGGGGGGGGTGTERVTNGGFESGISGWTASGSGAVTTARAHSGTHSDAPCATVNCTSTLTQSVVLPAGSHGALTFWTYVTTQESGTKVWDTLAAKVNGTTVATVSNASPRSAWFETTVDLASYAGQTITLSFAETNDAELPTSFYLDDVSVLA
ncbi:MAG TPA: hypothetical protein VHV49_11395 [Pseudonocardiaceae bacterium]|nr:hypothetical protein [Pseudonocardiaceae bacterium]